MCTASWWFSPSGGYELYFNRDEQKTRSLAEAPKAFSKNGTRFLAPIDTDRGGSWLAANEFGLTLCLLNHYPQGEVRIAQPTVATSTTRGRLVLESADAATVRAVSAQLEQQPLAQFAPFYFLVLAPNGERLLLIWDGETLERVSTGLEAPLTTSSFKTEAVSRERRSKFSWLTNAIAPHERPPLEHYHDQHDPARGAYSVLMNRADACTVSQTIVRLAGSSLSMEYRPIDWQSASRAGDVVRNELQLQGSSSPAAVA